MSLTVILGILEGDEALVDRGGLIQSWVWVERKSHILKYPHILLEYTYKDVH